MPAPAPISNVPLLSPLQHIPVDESARHTPSTTDTVREALAKHVDALQDAALRPAALKSLAAYILEKEQNPCGRSLAMLVHPGAEADPDTSCGEPQGLPPRNSPERSNSPAEQTDRPADVSHPIDEALAYEREARARFDAALRNGQLNPNFAVDTVLAQTRQMCERFQSVLHESNFPVDAAVERLLENCVRIAAAPEERRSSVDSAAADFQEEAAMQAVTVPWQKRATLVAAIEAMRETNIQVISAQWKQHVSYATAEIDSATQKDGDEPKKAYAPPSPPRSLMEFAIDEHSRHPGENALRFLQPFEQLARCGIQIPEDIGLVFKHRILAFDTFRTMVDTYVDQLPMQTPAQLHSFSDVDLRKDAIYWEDALAALCAPLARALLARGKLSPETLLDWIGLKKRVDGLSLDRTTQSKEFPAPSERSEPITVLLARWHLLGDSKLIRSAISKAAFLEDPEKLRSLADNLVPRTHIAYLLSIADSVDWPALAAEMDRVASEHKALNAGISPEERSSFYSVLRPTSREHNERLEETRLNMAPYLLVNTLRSDERLDTWTVAKALDGDQDPQFRLELRPARALFEDWTDRNIPVERQGWMGRFMKQGFDQAWAENVVETHASDPTRMRVWFSDFPDADLDSRLNRAMQDAVARWLADEDISAHMLSQLPGLIQSEMSVEQIDEMLREATPDIHYRMDNVFDSNTPQKTRYGIITTKQLLDRILGRSAFDHQDRRAEARQLREVSELSRKAAAAQDRLRGMLRAVEALRADMKSDTPQARQCESFAGALKDASDILGKVLQPRTDTHWEQEGRELDNELSALIADLNFRITGLVKPAGTETAGPWQFV